MDQPTPPQQDLNLTNPPQEPPPHEKINASTRGSKSYHTSVAGENHLDGNIGTQDKYQLKQPPPRPTPLTAQHRSRGKTRGQGSNRPDERQDEMATEYNQTEQGKKKLTETSQHTRPPIRATYDPGNCKANRHQQRTTMSPGTSKPPEPGQESTPQQDAKHNEKHSKQRHHNGTKRKTKGTKKTRQSLSANVN
ncbi:hypothetical protein M378DRAFT_13444 [Amanita muscaria Koide BX008]|uniref:Uncharacterized protein n=1 Tax=Amanita muscaria (strain Koide BX008) TaxID=946122 RepID=A0A0C2WJ33_AMAMK|nr:hypothetical protein M378DRAFT_13444 [Amanita muscaria Koide BX008]